MAQREIDKWRKPPSAFPVVPSRATFSAVKGRPDRCPVRPQPALDDRSRAEENRAVNKTFRAVLQKSPSKGGWTYVVMAGSAKYSDERSCEGAGNHGRRTVSELLHGARRRDTQAPGQGRNSKEDGKDVGDTVTVRRSERLSN